MTGTQGTRFVAVHQKFAGRGNGASSAAGDRTETSGLASVNHTSTVTTPARDIASDIAAPASPRKRTA